VRQDPPPPAQSTADILLDNSLCVCVCRGRERSVVLVVYQHHHPQVMTTKTCPDMALCPLVVEFSGLGSRV
jgi:hypothetical protein